MDSRTPKKRFIHVAARTSKLFRYVALLIITIVSMIFVWRHFVEILASGGIADLPLRSLGWLIFSMLLALATTALAGEMFARFLGLRGLSVLGSVYLASQISKYVPGRLWNLIFQKVYLPGNPSWSTVVAANVKVFGLLLSAQLISCIVALFLLNGWELAVLLLLAVTSCMPWLLILSSKRLLALLGLSNSTTALTASLGWRLGVVLVMFVLLSFTAWMALYAGAFGLGMDASTSLVFISMVAWLAGLASVLPAGLGVREAVYLALRPDFLVVPEAMTMASLAIATRIWLLSVDVLVAAVGFSVLLAQRMRAK
jgi:uncharacterized membrane protein YbhN (UPF0104 family)